MKTQWFRIYSDVLEDGGVQNITEVLILSHIIQFENDGKCCFSSNEFFAYWLRLTEGEVEYMLRSLEKRGRIKITKALTGTARMIATVRPEVHNCQISDIFDDL